MAEKQMHGIRAWLDYKLKHSVLLYRLFSFSANLAFRLFGLFIHVDKKLVLFTGLSRKYNDSPRVLYERMLNMPELKDFKFVWALEDPGSAEIPGHAMKIQIDTLRYFKTALKAGYWVACVNIERGLHFKKQKCKYLNTWHGIPFKYIGNDVEGRTDFDFRHINFVCYASEYEKKIYLRAFRTQEQSMIPSGLPRNDELYSVGEERILEIRQRLGLPLDKRIILYAPTWRDSTDSGNTYVIKPPINTTLWEKELSSDYIVLFRMHGYTNKLLGIEFNDTIQDYSHYPRINDLLIVSDILISDYSAIIADYSILERPVICFAYDYEEYKKARGLYIDMEKDMPSGVLRTEREVLNHIKTMDYNKECQKTKSMIKNQIVQYGGNATEDCIKLLFSL